MPPSSTTRALSSLPQRASSVSVGRAYELLSLGVLRRYSFQLIHSGRPGDRGQDFIGHWVLPNQRVKVVGQCKHHRLPLGPRDVREFESVLQRTSHHHHHHHHHYNHHQPITGVIISHSGFSQQATETGRNSHLPLILSQIRPLTDDLTPDLSQGDGGEGDSGYPSHQVPPGSKLSERGVALSQIGLRLSGSEESSMRYLRRRGLFTRKLPRESTAGYISEFLVNSAAMSLLPCVSTAWRYDTDSGYGLRRRDILLLFRCPLSDVVYDLGGVSRRHAGSGEPISWNKHH